ncbi:MAG: hypothetical protein K6E51_10640 [Treponema sp.]|nr:hypothetical protein [Treponema sp.]
MSNKTNLSFTSISYLMGHSPQMVEHYSKHFSNDMYMQAVSQIALSGLWPKSSAVQLEVGDTVTDCMKDCVPKRSIVVSPDVVEQLYGIYCQLGELLQHLR